MTFTTIFLMLFGGLLLMPMPAAAVSATTTDRVNLRTGPGLGFDVIGLMPEGASLTVDGDVENGYYPVTYAGIPGYASAAFISIGGNSISDGQDGDDGVAVTDGAPTGSAWVTADRLNFRDGPSLGGSVISVLADGDTVELTGQQSNGYWQAVVNGTTGWLAADYLTTTAAPTEPTPDPGGGSVDVGDVATGSATVTANVNLRSGPGLDYSVVTVMPSGTSVELRGDPQNGYQPLSFGGRLGWASGDFLNVGGLDPDPDPNPGPGGGSVPVGDTTTGVARATATLNLRNGPGQNHAVQLVMPSGAIVELRGDPQNGFYPLSYNGTTGWASGDYLTIGSTGSGPDPDPEPTPDPNEGSVEVGDTVTGVARVTATLNLRSGPGLAFGARLAMPSGAIVELRGDPQNGYYPLSYNGTTGWASGTWLQIGNVDTDPDPDPTPTPDPSTGPDGRVVPVGDAATGAARTTVSLNLRAGPGTDYDVRRVMPNGAIVELRGDPQNNFYPLSYNGTTGWASGEFLDLGTVDPDPSPGPDAGNSDGNGDGNGAVPQYLYTTVSLNMRTGPSADNTVVWRIPPLTRVTITGEPRNGYYPATWAHVSGWLEGDTLSATYQGPATEGKEEIVAIIYAAADYYGQPREDMLRVAQCESGLRPGIKNTDFPNDPNAARGLFQFRPSTWATTPYADQDIYDAEANAYAAAWMWSVGRRNEWACQ